MKVFAGGDAHCGSSVGLTPPDWQTTPEQEEAWDMFCTWVEVYGPWDLAIWNGDMIDGKGKRSGGTEQITTDRGKQVDMAEQVITAVGAKNNLLIFGTPYHTGQDEDWEERLAKQIHAPIKDHAFVNIGGVVFSIKHKVGASTIPHGRLTALAKEKLWNTIWAVEKEQNPKAQIILRSHVHYHVYCGQKGPNWWKAITLPALQGLGSKFGARQCSGTVDWGFAWFDIDNGKVRDWDVCTTSLEQQKNEVLQYG